MDVDDDDGGGDGDVAQPVSTGPDAWKEEVRESFVARDLPRTDFKMPQLVRTYEAKIKTIKAQYDVRIMFTKTICTA